MAANFRTSKGCYVFHNANPAGKLNAGDCVIRAISTATNADWDKVFLGLCAVGLELKDVASSKPVYTKYLQNIGYPMQKQPRKRNNTKYTAEEFVREHNREKRAEKHTLIRKLRKWDVESKIIYSWMLKNNITTAQLARLVGVNQRTVQRWLFESKNPTNVKCRKLEALMESI